MRELDYMEKAREAMAQLSAGAFLTVETARGRLNTMTIGWAQIGLVWMRPILSVMVRDSRHTFALMEEAEDFTVSFPQTGVMAEALVFCGTQSGANFDKFAECDLQAIDGKKTRSPIIAMKGLHYECRIVLRAAMQPERLHPDLESLYPAKDFHTLYHGEILSCYET